MVIRRNIRIMYAMSLLQGMVFYVPVATLYRQQAGLGIFEMTLIESLSLALTVFLELPWGVVADRIGYRRSMIVCSMLFFASKLVFWQADGFGMFLLERLMLGVVVSGLSGLDQSILYCSCEKGRAQTVFGIYNGVGTAGLLLASGTYSLLIGENYRLAGALTVISYGLAAALSLGLKEVRPQKRENAGAMLSFRKALGELKAAPGLLCLLVAAALLGETIHTITVFLNQLQYVRCGLSESAMGAILSGITVLGLLGVFSARLTRRLGATRMGAGLFGGCALACALLAVTENPWLSIGCIALLEVAASLFGPLRGELENRRVTGDDRATALSANALLCDSAAIAVNLGFGRIADRSLPEAMGLGALLCSIGLILFLASRKK